MRAAHCDASLRAAAIEESFFLGLRLNRGVDLDRLREEVGPDAIAAHDSASSKASTTVFSNAKPQSSA